MVASGAFTPRSISGLALWLDASDTTSTYTTDAGPVTAVSSPTEISGCALWLDASDAATLFAGNTGDTLATTTVGRWADKSGSGSPAASQATSGIRPQIASSSLNGRSTIEFDDTDSLVFGSSTAAFNYLHNATGATMFVVWKPAATSNPDAIRYLFNSTNNSSGNTGVSIFMDDRSSVTRNNSLQFTVSRGVSGTPTSSLSHNDFFTAANSFCIMSAVMDNANATAASRLVARQNGVASSATNTAANAAAATNASLDLTIGNFGGGGAPAAIAEIIFYQGVISATDRARVEAYLAAKWGISGVHAPATASSDPVGYWADKSGNARHATQSTATSRPTISVNTQGGRKMLGFDGANGRMTVAFPVTAADPVSMIAVARRGATAWGGGGGGGYGSFLNSTGGSSGGPQLRVDTGNIEVIGGTNKSSTLGSSVGVGSCAIIEGMVSSVATSLYVQGALVDSDAGAGSITTTGTRTSIGAWNDGTQGGGPLAGDIAELICYRASLSTSQRQRLERYLAAKWGIVLAPQVSNADAQDWVNRVYANGGSVSASTASAVNTLCDSLDAASLRDRFYRLNLFCGTGLNACLVPLYRGPSLSGTQYGNTTDTNVGPFVTGDYNETGAGGGLLGNGSSKYLSTGLTVSDIGTAASGHMSVYHGLSSGVNANRYYMGANDATTGNRFYFGTDSFSTATVFGSYGSAQNASQSLAANGHGPAGHRILSRETASLLVATNTTGIATAVSTAAFAVFAVNRNGTVDRWHNSWISAYSIGLGLNSTQASAYRSILQTFQTALGRNV